MRERTKAAVEMVLREDIFGDAPPEYLSIIDNLIALALFTTLECIKQKNFEHIHAYLHPAIEEMLPADGNNGHKEDPT